MKQTSFAAACIREDIARGAKLLGIPPDEHIANVIAASQGMQPLDRAQAAAYHGDVVPTCLPGVRTQWPELRGMQ